MKRVALSLTTTLVLVAAPALAAERIAASSVPERIAFGIILVGTIAFFGWVVWLVLRR